MRNREIRLVVGLMIGNWAGAAASQGLDSFRDCDGCPQMVVVAAGAFLMGSSTDDIVYLVDNEGGDPAWYPVELPRHEVRIAAPFAIGRFEVTVAEWDRCHAAGGCGHHPDDGGGRGELPVTDVSLLDAEEYGQWLSGLTGKRYRLPSESEWEYAARAGTATLRYWGRVIGSGHANCTGCGNPFDGQGTVAVGSFPANPFGLYDMLGNVEEWVADCWHFTYKRAPADGHAWSRGPCYQRPRRGGGWNTEPWTVRAAFRQIAGRDFRLEGAGFRIARDLD